MKRMCMQEKRRGEATKSYNAKSSKEVDYSEKTKAEPKFEPRISMYKYDPVQGVSVSKSCLNPV